MRGGRWRGGACRGEAWSYALCFIRSCGGKLWKWLGRDVPGKVWTRLEKAQEV